MQTCKDGVYCWILNAQNHFTKYCHLRPLKSKRAAEVAIKVFEIFVDFGAPLILQSDNGKEFVAEVISELKMIWPSLKIVHGAPRKPSTQGSVERSNFDVKVMLGAWMRDNNSKRWSFGLRFVQQQKNNRFHSGIKCTPFSATFGSDCRNGLENTAIPSEKWHDILSEEDILSIIGNQEVDNNKESAKSSVESEEVIETIDPVIEESDRRINEEGSQQESEEESQQESVEERRIVTRKRRISEIQEQATEGIVKQSKRMLGKSKKFLPEVAVGDLVLLRVPDVDRGPTDAANLLCMIKTIKHDNLYELASEVGILDRLLARNDFEKIDLFISDFSHSDNSISVRQAVKNLSISGGQGYIKCNCKTKCDAKSTRCTCKKLGIKCNSRCHGSSTCANNYFFIHFVH